MDADNAVDDAEDTNDADGAEDVVEIKQEEEDKRDDVEEDARGCCKTALARLLVAAT
jgi:hypothetical protein